MPVATGISGIVRFVYVRSKLYVYPKEFVEKSSVNYSRLFRIQNHLRTAEEGKGPLLLIIDRGIPDLRAPAAMHQPRFAAQYAACSGAQKIAF